MICQRPASRQKDDNSNIVYSRLINVQAASLGEHHKVRLINYRRTRLMSIRNPEALNYRKEHIL